MIKIEEGDNEYKARLRLNELRVKALLKILGKEGIATPEEVEEEVNSMLEDDDEDNDKE